MASLTHRNVYSATQIIPLKILNITQIIKKLPLAGIVGF